MAAIAALGILPAATASADAKHEKPRAAVTAKHKAAKKSKSKAAKRGKARATAAAYTTLTPSSGPRGTKVTVKGSNFARDKYGWIKFRGVKVADIKTDGYGRFSKVITVPSSAALGSATVLASAGAYPSQDGATFNVTSTTTVAPTATPVPTATATPVPTATPAPTTVSGTATPAPTPTPTPTPAPTTATTSTAPASLFTSLFDGSGWEKYSSDALSGAGYSATKSVVSSPARSGDGAAKIHMPNPSTKSHYLWKANNVSWGMGDDTWVGISMRLGDDWKLTESQLRLDGETFASLWGFRGSVANGPGGGIYATWKDGKPMFSSKTISGSVGAVSGEIFFGPYTKNVWYDFVVHIKWSSDPRVGIREYWLNGVKVGEWRGATMYESMTVRNRIGIYQGPGVDHDRTVYYDNHRIGKSFAEVNPAR